MQRRVGAACTPSRDCAAPRRPPPRRRPGGPPSSTIGRRGRSAGRLGVVDVDDVARRREIGDHDRERLVAALLARAKPGHRRLVGGVAGEVVAADALDRDDAAGARASAGPREGGSSPMRRARRVPPARPTSSSAGPQSWQAMVCAWKRRSAGSRYSPRAAAHRPSRPWWSAPVVGQRGHHGEPGTAGRTRDERVPVPAVGGVGQLGQALVAGGDVGRGGHRRQWFASRPVRRAAAQLSLLPVSPVSRVRAAGRVGPAGPVLVDEPARPVLVDEPARPVLVDEPARPGRQRLRGPRPPERRVLVGAGDGEAVDVPRRERAQLTCSTSATAGASLPMRRQKASTASAGPCTSATTPAPSLRTQPASPSSSASRWTNGRKPTPWTTPRTRTLRRSIVTLCMGTACLLDARYVLISTRSRVAAPAPGVSAVPSGTRSRGSSGCTRGPTASA